ncbi:hypothetical protein KI372_02970 [Halobacterium salinarum]|uniref:homing endonuclease associated repeat-containing protein n=1 Tax=Halobacterium salinarum TaxID=2242 RepID=UPI001F2D3AAF|nr:hypothetical protein [Halobacterium salinarum]MCF2207277.1 hypothetical protein [Halobacterium salinarum]MCF2240398.1 hypothetical protein [Halobacterium salinarum]
MSEADLIAELRRLNEELGHVPRKGEMEDQGGWTGSISQKRFGSWNEALTATGFELNERWRIPQKDLLTKL